MGEKIGDARAPTTMAFQTSSRSIEGLCLDQIHPRTRDYVILRNRTLGWVRPAFSEVFANRIRRTLLIEEKPCVNSAPALDFKKVEKLSVSR
jgi:hypothetical protein